MGAGAEQPGWARWLDRFGWVAVVTAGFLAYHNCFDGQLYLDDPQVLPSAEEHQPRAGALVPNPRFSRWLGTWSFAAGAAAFGPSPGATHGVNLAIHLLAGVVLWGVVARTLQLPRFENQFAGRAGVLATVVAGLWVVHPLTTAAVTYLSQRFESQSGLFVLVALWALVRGKTAQRGRIWWYAVSVGAAGAATATKESAIVLPLVLLVYDRLFLAGSWRGVVCRWPLHLALLAVQAVALPIILSVALPMVVRTVSPPPPAPTSAPRTEEPLLLSGVKGLYRNDDRLVSAGFQTTGVSSWEYLRSQPEVILHYLRLSAVPHPLVFDYNWPIATDGAHIWPPGLVILALLGATVWAVARSAAGGFLGVWFFAFLAVSSSFVPIIDLAFEHRMYLPLMACVAAVVLAADRALNRIPRRGGALAVGAAGTAWAVLTVLTVIRNEDYRDPERLYRKLLDVVPDNGRCWTNLGVIYARAGRSAEAREAFRNALRYSDHRMIAIKQATWLNLIQLSLETSGPSPETIALVTEFVAVDPENPSRRFLLANVRFDARDPAGAAAEYRSAIELATRQGLPLREPMVFASYARALNESGDPAAAVPVYYRALECPNPPPMIRSELAQVLTRLGPDRYAEADTQLRAASAQAPQEPNGPYHLGVLRLHQGNPDDAANWFREALKRDRKHVWARLGLAQALHASGHPLEARQHFTEVQRVWAQWPQAEADLAWRMATHPDPRARYAAEGLRLARLIIAGVGDRNHGALDVLAAALAESGQFDEAERTAQRAADRARADGNTELAARYEARRDLYAKKQPYREPATAPR
jgi:tetratricopeptide (TPR) repeat protein